MIKIGAQHKKVRPLANGETDCRIREKTPTIPKNQKTESDGISYKPSESSRRTPRPGFKFEPLFKNLYEICAIIAIPR